jgi:hypothetical protein
VSTDFFAHSSAATATDGGTRPLTTLEVLDDEYWALVGAEPSAEERAVRAAYASSRRPDAVEIDPEERAFRHDLVTRLHRANRSAVCFSGGGIRSATFGLGVLQGLAAGVEQTGSRPPLVGEIDFLSTVSGGGYLGAWFSACAAGKAQESAVRGSRARRSRWSDRRVPAAGRTAADAA